MNKNNLILWGIPKNKSNGIDEILLLTSATSKDIEIIKTKAGRDGYHSFRVATINDRDKPDFINTITI